MAVLDQRRLRTVHFGLIVFFARVASALGQNAATQPTVAPIGLTPQERVQRLAEVFGPAVHFGDVTADGRRVPVDATFHFDSDTDLAGFAVVRNDWGLSGGALHGHGFLVSQIVCLLPLASDSCTVRGQVRSSDIFELYLLDPWADRVAGTRAVARIHFGRMENDAATDWMELSSKENALRQIYQFRFPDDAQSVSLELRDQLLRAELTVDGGSRIMRGQVPAADLAPVVHVALAGVVNSRVEADELQIVGSVDLASDQVTCLAGMGRAFWGEGRPVTLYYRARGCFRRLLVNGEVAATQEAAEGVWWPTEGPLLHTSVRLAYGDVLAFELAGVDDEGALHVVGVDDKSGRIVIASHPLTFAASWDRPDEAWYRTYQQEWKTRPHLAVAQDESLRPQFRRVLGREFPGLPVIGPAIRQNRCVYLKMQVR